MVEAIGSKSRLNNASTDESFGKVGRPNAGFIRLLWNASTKWYFFPLYYIVLALMGSVAIMISERKASLSIFVGGLLSYAILMPNGLLYMLTFGRQFYLYSPFAFPFLFLIVIVVSITLIIDTKLKRGRILRALIVVVLLLMTLSFVGCVIEYPRTFSSARLRLR